MKHINFGNKRRKENISEITTGKCIHILMKIRCATAGNGLALHSDDMELTTLDQSDIQNA